VQRSLLGQPLQLYVESLIVTDETIYQRFKEILNSTDQDLIFETMKIYYSFLVYGVRSYL
jgi:predicted ATPase